MKPEIKLIREKEGLSQEQVAEKMKISQSAYARFELSKTKIDLERIEAFADAVGWSMIDVLTFPERFINVKDIGKELNLYEPDLMIQIKVRGEKRENIMKTIFGDKDIEILNK